MTFPALATIVAMAGSFAALATIVAMASYRLINGYICITGVVCF